MTLDTPPVMTLYEPPDAGTGGGAGEEPGGAMYQATAMVGMAM
jgi:hypothetical protein